MGRHILTLSEHFADSEDFQYKLTPIYRDSHAINGKARKRATLRDTTASLVGFPGNYHHPLDPVSFIRFGINEIDESDTPQLLKLLEWGKAVRNFCLRQNLPVKPSAGGLAAQLLRDPRFYPRARRKVPKLVNAKGRDKLPGNYYHLRGDTDTYYDAVYLDMESAHHHIASTIELPCANSLRAYGFYSSDRPKPWARPGTERHARALRQYGLFHARVSVPHLPPRTFPLPGLDRQGRYDVWFFSNEIPLMESLGCHIETIYCALTSPEKDTGLSRYAEFALSELRENRDQKPWLKPALHSVYGVLAARPRAMEFGYRHANTDQTDLYPMGGKVVPVKVVKTSKAIEPGVVNTIHRGMIEAEQRVMALTLAGDLEKQGARIICIYADSIFAEMDQIPILPRPWAVKKKVSRLRFMSATSFVSPELTRLPGVPRKIQGNFAAAGRTRSLDPITGKPIRADSCSRVFRPGWVLECPGQVNPGQNRPIRKVKNNGSALNDPDASRQGPRTARAVRGNP